jgi:hypothetical protein
MPLVAEASLRWVLLLFIIERILMGSTFQVDMSINVGQNFQTKQGTLH